MVRDDWVVGGDRRAAAADRIYAVATDLVRLRSDRWSPLNNGPVLPTYRCRRRQTLVGAKAQVRDAVLMRLSAGIIDTVRHAVEGLSGAERVVRAITVALEQIRSDPIRRLMLTSGNSPEPGELHSSPMLGHLAAELTGITEADPQAAQWIVRVVVSLAYWPAGNSRVEQQTLRRFVAPAFKA